MLRTSLRFTLAVLAGVSLMASDAICPVYPVSQRVSDYAGMDSRRSALELSHGGGQQARAAAPDINTVNFIDDYIFRKMATGGVTPAPLTTDEEIVRRLSLDLSGRIPTPEAVAAFLADTDPDKRKKLIEKMIASEQFVDYWTFIFGNHFEVTSRYYNYIGIPGRNLFYSYLRDFIARDRSYKEVASEMISAAGDSHESAPANFLVRAYQQGDPIQDTYDTLTDRITTKFLGVQTQCVSCHDGRRHLEEINLYLTERKREEFWRLSAFVSRTAMSVLPVDAFYQQVHMVFTDRSVGGYTTAVSTINPGPRPRRSGGPYTPRYMFTGELPAGGDWRGELARMVTSDRQFARATVNYLWAHFFKYGIVDPPDGWDLARIDPLNPPPAPWPLQPSHPELLEALADEFIRSNYSVRHIVGLIAQSSAYQLSSRYPGQWHPQYERYFAKHFPRRLFAEEIYDALVDATGVGVPMFVEGFDKPVYYATQLPDPSEPRANFPVSNFLTTFGRGDWFQVPRNPISSTLQVLSLMNDSLINFRTFGNRNVTTRVTRVMQAGMDDAAAVNHLFLATLGRSATDGELTLLRARKTVDYERWLSDTQWALLNKIEFVFSN